MASSQGRVFPEADEKVLPFNEENVGLKDKQGSVKETLYSVAIM